MKLRTVSQILSLVLIAVVAIVFLSSAMGFKDDSREMYAQVIEETVQKYLIQCYASEGSYPPDLEYLAKNYGLILDHDNYIYHYQPFASNILPDVRVFVRRGDTQQEGIVF
ncbi:MAG: hypothetical protein R6W96_07605 [Clostridia bacterium]